MGNEEEKLISKAEEPFKKAPKLHSFYRGKIETIPKCRVKDYNDFNYWYTPGVAQPCRDIEKNPELVYEYTSKWNTIAVISDGTRVLGLGDIGPIAAMPVMEGKSLLFKYLGGVDSFPLCIDTKDPDKFIETVKLIHPSIGGINLEDIEQPKCFYILERLRKELPIPVWHDDQQGTAAVTLAGLINALKMVEKKLDEVKIVFLGAGAANIRVADLIFKAGGNRAKAIMLDSKGSLHMGRDDIRRNPSHIEKWKICQSTNKEQKACGLEEALKGADVLIALSKQGPGVVKKEWIRGMNDRAFVFAGANPVPEIWPWEAKEAGAEVVATCRSDFPNQINNSIGFPGIFRGALDVRAKTITDEMCVAAAYEMAKTAEDRGMDAESIIPTMGEWEVFPRVAAAVGEKAVQQGVALLHLSKDEIYENAEKIIRETREKVELLMKEGFIREPEGLF